MAVVLKMRVAVIGAGPAGLTAAYEIAKSGLDVDVYEASPYVGGMCRSFELWDQIVDLGPHRFFSSDPRVNRLWLEIADESYRLVDRTTRIYYKNKFFDYPLQATNAIKGLGLLEATRCVASYLRQYASPVKDDGTFESWVVSRFGRRLFEIFFKTYSEKLWGIPCTELDEDFAAQRIKKLSLAEAVKNALRIGGSGHRTLVDQFAYPTGGTGMIYERMAECVDALGSVQLNKPVRRVIHTDRKVTGIELTDGQQVAYDHVISTMPLTHLVRGLGDAEPKVTNAVNALRFRNTIVVYLNVDGVDLFPDQWVYVHSNDLEVGRVTNFRNWVPDIVRDSQTSILSLEYWCFEDEPRWAASDKQLIAQATREIQSTGLIGDAQVLDGHVERVPKCYPVYSKNYRQHLDLVTAYVDRFEGLTPIGRYGAFKYNNQDHSILMGLLAAANITRKHGNDLWAVNTDYETYQEATRITESGLVSVGESS